MKFTLSLLTSVFLATSVMAKTDPLPQDCFAIQTLVAQSVGSVCHDLKDREFETCYRTSQAVICSANYGFGFMNCEQPCKVEY
ncbi:hypothetical protein NX059_005096 [Plenodomus lindquistii]|nr:hypothetical protein NX059_005096 [Plenodomus lindquistii]